MGDLEKSIFYKDTSLSFISKTLFLFTFLFPLTAQAQQVYSGGEDDMRDIFVAGGYGALFGATMGTAILPFLSGSPMNNIRVVAGGASIGFMMGSAYGLYNVSKAQTNSYFNYTPENNDDNYKNNSVQDNNENKSNNKSNIPETRKNEPYISKDIIKRLSKEQVKVEDNKQNIINTHFISILLG